MKLKEKKLNRQTIYEGQVFNVFHDEVLLPNDKKSYRDIVEHHGGVCIAARKPDGHYLLVQQFRYPLNKNMLEFTAGKKEKGEDPLMCAKRELLEETGYQAKEFIPLGSFVPTCGYSTEIIYLYFADKLSFCGQNLDENEFLNVVELTLDDILNKIMSNEIDDAKTIIMAFKLNQLNK